MIGSLSRPTVVDFSTLPAEAANKLIRSTNKLPYPNIHFRRSENSEPLAKLRHDKRSLSLTKLDSHTRPSLGKGNKDCNVCEASLSLSSKISQCSHCRQVSCSRHCLNKSNENLICDNCNRIFLAEEIKDRGEIEDSDRLRLQLESYKSERDQLEVDNIAIDNAIWEKKNETAALRSRQLAEVQKLKEQLLAERERNLSAAETVNHIEDSVEEVKRSQNLTEASSCECKDAIEACKNELSIYTDQRNLLEARLSGLQRDFQGMISCKQILASVCRSCKSKVKHKYRKQLLESNFSETFSTFTRISRTEMHKAALTEVKRENCRCVVM